MSPDGRGPPEEKFRLALWTHQVVEYLLAALILMQSINGGDAAPLIAVAGGMLFVLAAVTDGPVSITKWVSPRVHRVLDFGVVAALVAAPILSGSTDPLAWALCLLAAGALLWINWHTQWTRPARRARRAATAAAPVPKPEVPKPGAPNPEVPNPEVPRSDAPEPEPEPTPPSKAAALGDSARALGAMVDRTTRGASRAAGRIYGRSKSRRPESGEKPDPDA